MTNFSGDPDNLNILLNSQNGSVSEQTIYRALVVHIPLAKKTDEEKKASDLNFTLNIPIIDIGINHLAHRDLTLKADRKY